MKKIVFLSLVGLLILVFGGCGVIPFTTQGEEQSTEVLEGLEIGLDPAVTLGLIQSKGDSIYHIPSDTSIGMWDSVNRIYTLTTDLNEGIKIDEDSLTLDGDGYTINGSGEYTGVYLYERSNVTVKNCVIYRFIVGIYLHSSSSNTLTDNTVNDNNDSGIFLSSSSSNTLTDNTVNDSNFGILLNSSSSNTLTDNTVNDNDSGIFLYSSSFNTLTDNTADNNEWGIHLDSSTDNEVYNNNFINNSTQAYVYGGSSNVFSLDKPECGNYWSDWTSPDDDGDGFVDSPYVFTGGQDNLPWVSQDGWKPTKATGYLITTVEDFELPEGIERSLIALLNAVIKSLENQHDQAAIAQLTGLIHHVEGLLNANKLTQEQTDTLIAAAQRIIGSIQ